MSSFWVFWIIMAMIVGGMKYENDKEFNGLLGMFFHVALCLFLWPIYLGMFLENWRTR